MVPSVFVSMDYLRGFICVYEYSVIDGVQALAASSMSVWCTFNTNAHCALTIKEIFTLHPTVVIASRNGSGRWIAVCEGKMERDYLLYKNYQLCRQARLVTVTECRRRQ